MAITRKKKETTLAELEENLGTAKSIIFADYRGTTVKKIDELRRKMRKEKIYTKVAKVTLIRKALQKYGIEALALDFKVPIAVIASMEDEVAPAKILIEFIKENKNVQVHMGIMDKKFLSAAEIASLAALPGKQELFGKLVGTIAAPLSGFVNVLAGNIRSLIYTLNAIRQSKS